MVVHQQGMNLVHSCIILLFVSVELVEELEELDVALAVGVSALGFLLEVLPLDCADLGCC